MGHIAVGIDAPAQPRDRFRVGAELQFGDTGNRHPPEGGDIAGRETERLVDIGLGFRAASEKKLGPTDASVSLGQISGRRSRWIEI